MKNKKTRLMAIVVFAMLTLYLNLSMVSARYMHTWPVGSFGINIASSFSGIVTKPEELAAAIASGKDFTITGEGYTTIDIPSENADDGNIEVTIKDATITGRILATSASEKTVTVNVDGVTSSSSNNNVLTLKNGAIMIVNSATIKGNPNVNGLVSITGGSKLIINDGEFACATFAMGDTSSTLEINGGTFIGVDHINGFMGSISCVGTVIIKGGTFDINPEGGTNVIIPDGYEVVDNGDGTWSVVEKTACTTHTFENAVCTVCGEICSHEEATTLSVSRTNHSVNCPTCGLSDSGSHIFVSGKCGCGLDEVPVYELPELPAAGETLTAADSEKIQSNTSGVTLYDANASEYGNTLLTGIPTGLGLSNDTDQRENLLRFFEGIQHQSNYDLDLNSRFSSIGTGGSANMQSVFEMYRIDIASGVSGQISFTLPQKQYDAVGGEEVGVIISVLHQENGQMTLSHTFFAGQSNGTSEVEFTIDASHACLEALQDPNTVTFISFISSASSCGLGGSVDDK